MAAKVRRAAAKMLVSECGQQQEDGLLLPCLPVSAGIPLHVCCQWGACGVGMLSEAQFHYVLGAQAVFVYCRLSHCCLPVNFGDDYCMWADAAYSSEQLTCVFFFNEV